MAGYDWYPSSKYQSLPREDIVFFGNDSDGSKIYVGRAEHNGDVLPAKVIPSKKVCYVCCGGNKILKSNYEILCGSGFKWIKSSNGRIPRNAVFSGTADGVEVAIGRAQHQGRLYMPFGGGEIVFKNFEVLVYIPKSKWVKLSTYGQFPTDAVRGGADRDGRPIYVGRAYHNSDLLPAKLVPHQHAAYVCYGGREISKENFEVLCGGSTRWIPSGSGSSHPVAVIGGQTSDGETLYIGRSNWNGSMICGKIHPSHKVLYIPYDGNEISIQSYEILIEI